MYRYRVYTENVNYDETLALAKSTLPESFTVFHAQGFYQGAPEKTLVFEVIADDTHAVTAFAYRVKKQNNQDCVLVTAEEVNSFIL